jgi:hypothetical protein
LRAQCWRHHVVDPFLLGSNGVPAIVFSDKLIGRMVSNLGYMQRQCGGVAVPDFATQPSVPCRKSNHQDLHSFACSRGNVCFSIVRGQRSVICSSTSSMGPMSRRCTVGLLASPLLVGSPQMSQGVASSERLDLLVNAAGGEGELHTSVQIWIKYYLCLRHTRDTQFRFPPRQCFKMGVLV